MQTFENFWKSQGGDKEAFQYARDVKDVSKSTWEACKAEILKILDEHKTTVYPESEFCDQGEDPTGTEYITEDVIDKIRKL